MKRKAQDVVNHLLDLDNPERILNQEVYTKYKRGDVVVHYSGYPLTKVVERVTRISVPPYWLYTLVDATNVYSNHVHECELGPARPEQVEMFKRHAGQEAHRIMAYPDWQPQ